jgi:transposase
MGNVQVTDVAGAGGVVLVAIELSKTTWLLAVHDPFTSKVSHRRVDGGDADGLIAPEAQHALYRDEDVQ